MRALDETDRKARGARLGAFALAGLLPLVELGRIALSEPLSGVAAAAALVLLSLPLHLRHVAYALRNQRAPYAGCSLAALAILMALGVGLVESSWGFLLSSLAVSVLLVVRPPWSLLILLSVLAVAYAEGSAEYSDEPTAATQLYLALAVVLRSVCLFAIIRLAAQVSDLREARATVTKSAVAQQRERTALRLTGSLLQDLERLEARALAVPPPASTGTAQGVAGLADDARLVMAEVRRIARDTRDEASWRDLSDAGLLLRGQDRPAAARRPPRGSPAAGLTARVGRAILLFVLVRLVALGMLLSFVAGLGVGVRLPTWCFFAAVAVAALELSIARRAARESPPPVTAGGVLTAAALVGLTAATMTSLQTPWPFAFSLQFVIAAAVMALPGRWRPAAVVAGLLCLASFGYREALLADLGAAELAWYLLGYLPAVCLLAVGSLVGSARLVSAVRGLESARQAQAAQAAESERRRFSRDLHDTLVQRLSAVALTADLVERMLPFDLDGAARELSDLRALTSGLADDARRVGQDARSVSLADETWAAAQLLRAAGVRAEVRLRARPRTAEADALLGWAVREAATNVVRHSAATWCAIEVAHADGVTGLTVVNDGVHEERSSPAGRGSGLAGLSDRTAAAGGSLAAGRSGPGDFRLAVRVPDAGGGGQEAVTAAPAARLAASGQTGRATST